VLLDALHLGLGNDGPVTLRADVGHDAHAAHPGIFGELAESRKLLHHFPDLTRLAIHDVSYEKHTVLLDAIGR
jgi:hypothetical protein